MIKAAGEQEPVSMMERLSKFNTATDNKYIKENTMKSFFSVAGKVSELANKAEIAFSNSTVVAKQLLNKKAKEISGLGDQIRRQYDNIEKFVKDNHLESPMNFDIAKGHKEDEVEVAQKWMENARTQMLELEQRIAELRYKSPEDLYDEGNTFAKEFNEKQAASDAQSVRLDRMKGRQKQSVDVILDNDLTMDDYGGLTKLAISPSRKLEDVDKELKEAEKKLQEYRKNYSNAKKENDDLFNVTLYEERLRKLNDYYGYIRTENGFDISDLPILGDKERFAELVEENERYEAEKRKIQEKRTAIVFEATSQKDYEEKIKDLKDPPAPKGLPILALKDSIAAVYGKDGLQKYGYDGPQLPIFAQTQEKVDSLLSQIDTVGDVENRQLFQKVEEEAKNGLKHLQNIVTNEYVPYCKKNKIPFVTIEGIFHYINSAEYKNRVNKAQSMAYSPDTKDEDREKAQKWLDNHVSDAGRKFITSYYYSQDENARKAPFDTKHAAEYARLENYGVTTYHNPDDTHEYFYKYYDSIDKEIQARNELLTKENVEVYRYYCKVTEELTAEADAQYRKVNPYYTQIIQSDGEAGWAAYIKDSYSYRHYVDEYLSSHDPLGCTKKKIIKEHYLLALKKPSRNVSRNAIKSARNTGQWKT